MVSSRWMSFSPGEVALCGQKARYKDDYGASTSAANSKCDLIWYMGRQTVGSSGSTELNGYVLTFLLRDATLDHDKDTLFSTF